MKRTLKYFAAAGMVSGALLLADNANAQQLGYAVATNPRTAPDPATLEAQARELYTSPKTYRRAAELHLDAAALRDAGDPKRVENISLAARLYYYDGDMGRARTLLEKAADTAIAAGDVVNAASLYLDASYVAQQEKDGADVRRLVDKAKLLMNSPLVDAADRERILSRIADDV